MRQITLVCHQISLYYTKAGIPNFLIGLKFPSWSIYIILFSFFYKNSVKLPEDATYPCYKKLNLKTSVTAWLKKNKNLYAWPLLSYAE